MIILYVLFLLFFISQYCCVLFISTHPLALTLMLKCRSCFKQKINCNFFNRYGIIEKNLSNKIASKNTKAIYHTSKKL